jgi:hypothetical protein
MAKNRILPLDFPGQALLVSRQFVQPQAGYWRRATAAMAPHMAKNRILPLDFPGQALLVSRQFVQPQAGYWRRANAIAPLGGRRAPAARAIKTAWREAYENPVLH